MVIEKEGWHWQQIKERARDHQWSTKKRRACYWKTKEEKLCDPSLIKKNLLSINYIVLSQLSQAIACSAVQETENVVIILY